MENISTTPFKYPPISIVHCHEKLLNIDLLFTSTREQPHDSSAITSLHHVTPQIQNQTRIKHSRPPKPLDSRTSTYSPTTPPSENPFQRLHPHHHHHTELPIISSKHSPPTSYPSYQPQNLVKQKHHIKRPCHHQRSSPIPCLMTYLNAMTPPNATMSLSHRPMV